MSKQLYLLITIQVTLFSCDLHGLIILLNGTSSAGKSSIAKDLHKVLEKDCQVIAIDDNRKNNISFFEEVQKAAQEKKYVIVDTILKSFDDCQLRQIKNHEFFFVLVYCPFNKIIKHLEIRNNLTTIDEQRSLFDALYFFSFLYDVEKDKSLCLDSILCKDCLSLLEKSLEKEERNMAYDFFLKKFICDDYIQFKPKYQYDIIVNTAKKSSKQCARKILSYIKKHNNFVAFKNNYKNHPL